MKICNYLTKGHIFLDMKSSDKRALLGEFVAVLKEMGSIEQDQIILESLLKREGLGSTGLEKGIAIPHALVDGVDGPIIALSVLKDGIDFEAADGMPTYVVLLLLGNKNNPGNQLKILAHVCRLVKETDFVEKVKMATVPEDICDILEKDEGKIG
ncbi:PTS sugar transporter subunit IIA [Acidobacteriota bacterium]